MACRFCATGGLTFQRNLTAAEIADQINQTAVQVGTINNVVYMGMGEPFDNYDEVIRSAHILNHSHTLIRTTAIRPDRLRREIALHTRMEEVGELAQRSGVGTLVLVRLRPPPVYDIQITSEVNNRFDGVTVIPDDGDEITP